MPPSSTTTWPSCTHAAARRAIEALASGARRWRLGEREASPWRGSAPPWTRRSNPASSSSRRSRRTVSEETLELRGQVGGEHAALGAEPVEDQRAALVGRASRGRGTRLCWLVRVRARVRSSPPGGGRRGAPDLGSRGVGVHNTTNLRAGSGARVVFMRRSTCSARQGPPWPGGFVRVTHAFEGPLAALGLFPPPATPAAPASPRIPQWHLSMHLRTLTLVACAETSDALQLRSARDDEDIRAASLQYVRKISGFTSPRAPTRRPSSAPGRRRGGVYAARCRSWRPTPAKDREVEAEKARARAVQRYAA